MRKVLAHSIFLLPLFFLISCSSDSQDDPLIAGEKQQEGQNGNPNEEPTIEISSIINTSDQGKLIDAFFFDLKGWPDRTNTIEKATAYFVNDGMNGLRISIYGDIQRPAHPGPGVVVASGPKDFCK